jgi:hypothetical protein
MEASALYRLRAEPGNSDMYEYNNGDCYYKKSTNMYAIYSKQILHIFFFQTMFSVSVRELNLLLQSTIYRAVRK